MENHRIYIHPKHIARAWMSLTPEQQQSAIDQATAMDTAIPPVIFPCPPTCPTSNG